MNYDGYYSFGFNTKHTRTKNIAEYITRIAKRTKYNIDVSMPIDSSKEDGYVIVTFGYWRCK